MQKYLIAHLVIVLFGTSIAQAQFRNASDEFSFSSDGKAAFCDIDNDGWIDLFAGGVFYRNENGKRFNKVDAGIVKGEGIWGDCNNDGFADLFVFNTTGALYLNNGDLTFNSVEFPDLPTVNSRGAVWIDLNNDALLDLYVGGYEIWEQSVHPDFLFLNQGNGSFEESWRSPENGRYSARGVTAADFDNDGTVEIFVSNYRLQPNILWDTDAQTNLKDVAKQRGAEGHPDKVITYTGGVQYPICGHTIGSAWGDLNNDGYLDLFVGNFSHPPANQNRPQFLKNLGKAGEYRFEDVSDEAGLEWQESFASPALGDFDNDGDLDLFFTTVYATGSGGIKNYPVLYRNEGSFRFVNVTEEQGLDLLGPTYQAAWADIDNDGDVDLCTNGKIFINENKTGNWLTLSLQGDGNHVNHSAIGATVRIKLGQQELTRHVEAGTGEGNQNDPRLHFGLGNHSEKVEIEITWPRNIRQVVSDLNVNEHHVIKFKHGR